MQWAPPRIGGAPYPPETSWRTAAATVEPGAPIPVAHNVYVSANPSAAPIPPLLPQFPPMHNQL